MFFSFSANFFLLKISFDLAGLYLLIRGTSKCKWRKLYENERKEDFFSSRVILVEKCVTLRTKSTMKAGKHRFIFECVLPPELPASFEAKWGSVRYKIEVKMDIPMAIDEFRKIFFNITRKKDLNDDPNMRKVIHSIREKEFWSNSAPFKMKVTIPQTGWAAGQMLKLKVDYDNKSEVTISRTQVTLSRIVTYMSIMPYPSKKIENYVVCTFAAAGCAGRSRITHEGSVEIPINLVPTTAPDCAGCMKIEYELKIEAFSIGLHNNVSINCPIAIGSIPLLSESEWQAKQRERKSRDMTQPNASTSYETSPALTSPNPPFTFPYPHMSNFPQPVIQSQALHPNDMPPPSYEEAMSAFGEHAPSAPLN